MNRDDIDLLLACADSMLVILKANGTSQIMVEVGEYRAPRLVDMDDIYNAIDTVYQSSLDLNYEE